MPGRLGRLLPQHLHRLLGRLGLGGDPPRQQHDRDHERRGHQDDDDAEADAKHPLGGFRHRSVHLCAGSRASRPPRGARATCDNPSGTDHQKSSGLAARAATATGRAPFARSGGLDPRIVTARRRRRHDAQVRRGSLFFIAALAALAACAGVLAAGAAAAGGQQPAAAAAARKGPPLTTFASCRGFLAHVRRQARIVTRPRVGMPARAGARARRPRRATAPRWPPRRPGSTSPTPTSRRPGSTSRTSSRPTGARSTRSRPAGCGSSTSPAPRRGCSRGWPSTTSRRRASCCWATG